MEILINGKYKIYKDKYGICGYNLITGQDLPKYVLDIMKKLED